MHAIRLLLRYDAIVDTDHESLHCTQQQQRDRIVHVLIHFGGANIECKTNREHHFSNRHKWSRFDGPKLLDNSADPTVEEMMVVTNACSSWWTWINNCEIV